MALPFLCTYQIVIFSPRSCRVVTICRWRRWVCSSRNRIWLKSRPYPHESISRHPSLLRDSLPWTSFFNLPKVIWSVPFKGLLPTAVFRPSLDAEWSSFPVYPPPSIYITIWKLRNTNLKIYLRSKNESGNLFFQPPQNTQLLPFFKRRVFITEIEEGVITSDLLPFIIHYEFQPKTGERHGHCYSQESAFEGEFKTEGL